MYLQRRTKALVPEHAGHIGQRDAWLDQHAGSELPEGMEVQQRPVLQLAMAGTRRQIVLTVSPTSHVLAAVVEK